MQRGGSRVKNGGGGGGPSGGGQQDGRRHSVKSHGVEGGELGDVVGLALEAGEHRLGETLVAVIHAVAGGDGHEAAEPRVMAPLLLRGGSGRGGTLLPLDQDLAKKLGADGAVARATEVGKRLASWEEKRVERHKVSANLIAAGGKATRSTDESHSAAGLRRGGRVLVGGGGARRAVVRRWVRGAVVVTIENGRENGGDSMEERLGDFGVEVNEGADVGGEGVEALTLRDVLIHEEDGGLLDLRVHVGQAFALSKLGDKAEEGGGRGSSVQGSLLAYSLDIAVEILAGSNASSDALKGHGLLVLMRRL